MHSINTHFTGQPPYLSACGACNTNVVCRMCFGVLWCAWCILAHELAPLAVRRPHGIELGTDIDQSCFRGGCPAGGWSYLWDYEPMIETFDWFTDMATYPANVDRPAASFLEPASVCLFVSLFVLRSTSLVIQVWLCVCAPRSVPFEA